MAHPMKHGRHKHQPAWLGRARSQEGAGPVPAPPQHPGLDDVPDANQASALPGAGAVPMGGGDAGGGDEADLGGM